MLFAKIDEQRLLCLKNIKWKTRIYLSILYIHSNSVSAKITLMIL